MASKRRIWRGSKRPRVISEAKASGKTLTVRERSTNGAWMIETYPLVSPIGETVVIRQEETVSAIGRETISIEVWGEKALRRLLGKDGPLWKARERINEANCAVNDEDRAAALEANELARAECAALKIDTLPIQYIGFRGITFPKANDLLAFSPKGNVEKQSAPSSMAFKDDGEDRAFARRPDGTTCFRFSIGETGSTDFAPLPREFWERLARDIRECAPSAEVYSIRRGAGGSNSGGHLKRENRAPYRSGSAPQWAREALEEMDRLTVRLEIAKQTAHDARVCFAKAELAGDWKTARDMGHIIGMQEGAARSLARRIAALEDRISMGVAIPAPTMAREDRETMTIRQRFAARRADKARMREDIDGMADGKGAAYAVVPEGPNHFPQTREDVARRNNILNKPTKLGKDAIGAPSIAGVDPRWTGEENASPAREALEAIRERLQATETWKLGAIPFDELRRAVGAAFTDDELRAIKEDRSTMERRIEKIDRMIADLGK